MFHIAAKEAVKGINDRIIGAYLRALIPNQSERSIDIDLAFTVEQVYKEVTRTAKKKDADIDLEVNAFLPEGPRADLLHLIIIHPGKENRLQKDEQKLINRLM